MAHASSETGHEYVLGTDRAELERLGLQHTVWRAQAVALWERAGFTTGQRLLDIGCGPGFTTRDLALVAGPTGSVLGVDASERFLATLRDTPPALGAAPITAQHADVQALDLPAQSLDGAYSRWVLSFVPDPGKVIASVARALKPGATFALQEYVSYGAMRLAPPCPEMALVAQAVDESWQRQGGRADVGLLLPDLLHAHGLVVESATPLSRTARPGTLLWEWPRVFFTNFLPRLVADGLLAHDVHERFQAAFATAGKSPGGLFLTPTVLDIVARKPRAAT